MKLLVLEQDSARPLAAILMDHLPGWDVASVHEVDGHSDAAAVLIADFGRAPTIAADLRRAGMIGPIIALVDTETAGVVPPVIALAKPLRLAGLIARLNTPGDAAIDGVIIGEWRFDAGARSLLHETSLRSERLTDKEAQILGLLLRAPEGISREALQEAAFGYGPGIDTHTVETHIWRLRQKLEEDPSTPRLLLTETQGARVVYYIVRP